MAERNTPGLQAPSLALAALVVAGGFLGSRLLGLLRSVLIAEAFGTQPELDAYWVAFRLPDLVFQLLAGATLASAFIPTFAGVRARQGEAAAWRLASSVLNLVFLATAAFAVAAFVLADRLVPLLAPGLGEAPDGPGEADAAQLRGLAVELTRVMLISPLLFAVSGMFMGILNARRHFLAPALAPMLYNLAIIVAALLADDVRALAWGVVVGAGLHLAVQLPALRAAGMAYRLVADWRDAAVRQVGRLMAPRMLGLAATQVSFYFVAIFFASRLGEGAISAVSFAWLIVMTPLGVIGMAIATAAFPTLAEQAAAAEHEALAATMGRALRLILFLSLPAGVGLALLAEPLVVVLLQRGAFDAASSDLTAQALVFYAPALFAHGAIEILSRGFYAQGDTKTPVGIAVLAMVLNAVLAALLVGPWEVRGLALALSLATVMEAALLFAALRPRVPGLADKGLVDAVARMAAATAALAVALAAARAAASAARIGHASGTEALATLVLGTAAGGGAYLVAAFLLRLQEPRDLLRRLPRRPPPAIE